jgi:hypothetical protein
MDSYAGTWESSATVNGFLPELVGVLVLGNQRPTWTPTLRPASWTCFSPVPMPVTRAVLEAGSLILSVDHSASRPDCGGRIIRCKVNEDELQCSWPSGKSATLNRIDSSGR